MNNIEIVDKYMKQYNLKESKIKNLIVKLAENKGIKTTEKDIEQWIKHQKETMNKEEVTNARKQK
ncbi:hypothetical protein [Photobacterium phosphoreum]|uniref:hypothetical protein n=1 Tax=Photobacterium phosphoreum TaxID=659 RepID=UPI0024B72EC9|nr:hypothetical protein [Photobacterium phosphoreum]